MPESPLAVGGAARRLVTAPPLAAFLAVCLGPYLGRLRFPSLYADDVVRVAQLRTSPLSAMLFRPFNEHMAPMFQGLSWLTWQLAGRQLAHAPLAFTVASFVPFALTLGLLAWLVRRETGSVTTALAGVAVFAVSWLAIEAVYWYSASSFMWALLATVAAWLAAASAVEGRRPWRDLGLAALASALAPAFSAIGLLAGPAAALRALTGHRPRAANAAAPVLGTALYLAVCSGFRYHDVLAANLERKANFGPGLLAAARAPVEALLPALLGLPPRSTSGVVAAVVLALTAVVAVTVAVRTRRSADRPLILGGLALIFGGYALAFCARADAAGRPALETQRYHLFPMLGLVLLLAPALRRGLGRWDARPAEGVWVATALAAVLLAVHYPEMRGRGRFFRHPDQVRTLAAIDRLGAVCAREGVTREQALATLDPIETEWTPPGHSALIMLGPAAETPALPDRLVKPTLLAALSASERRSVCGGMDATPYLQPAGESDLDAAPAVAVGHPVKLYRVRASGEARYVASGWPSFVEFAMTGTGARPADARALGLAGATPGEVTEVWWRGEREAWSETRSVRLRPDPSRPERAWLLPLDRLPHWGPAGAARIRLLFHAPGEVALAPPRLVR